MPEQYDNEKRFALFENDKGDNPKRPDFRGTMQIDGVAYKLSAWMKTSKQGQNFLSGSVEVDTKDQAPASQPSGGGFAAFGKSQPPATPAPDRSAPPANTNDGVDEDVPF